MSPPVLFLDIDGVLNGHEFDRAAESSTIRPACVKRLNRVLRETRCAVVISSAWRYMVLGGGMTLMGFGYMLRTHGVAIVGGLLGTTGRDTQTEDPNERGRQIKAWLAEHPEVTRYAVVDDMQLGFEGMPIVRTNGAEGLTDNDADKLIELLGGELFRRAGDVECEACGLRFSSHAHGGPPGWPEGKPFLRRICDGSLVKL